MFNRGTSWRLGLAVLAGFIGAAASGDTIKAQGAGEQVELVIGGGGVTGVYYPATGAICRLINERRHENGLFCVAEASDGSVENIDRIGSKDFHLAVVQADVAADAVHGLGRWSVGDKVEIRAVVGLYPEAITIIARANAGINKLEDLKGKRVGIGNAGSGARASWGAVERVLGWQRSDIRAVEVASADQGQALCDGRIDAYVWFAGHPSASVEETLASCEAVILDVPAEIAEKLLDESPAYRRITIPANTYPDQEDPVESIGSIALLIAGAEVSPETVAKVVDTLTRDVDHLRQLHPALSQTSRAVFTETGAIPLHPGVQLDLNTAGSR